MSPRLRPGPPEIRGFEYRALLGSGGYADVFLYEQLMPRRLVAVKVMLQDVADEGARERFDAEANLMAKLSSHPYIVTVHQVDVTADGRPFLVMEHCPPPNLATRYKHGRFSVEDALRIGVQVASAVETVHRAGMLHGDIKPANILVTEYGRPALTDFGISVATAHGPVQAHGLSVPWSPPEALAAGGLTTAASDVYSLAATIYSLLAGRSPFGTPGGSDETLELASRIESTPLPPIGREDVPASLERVLATAMAKAPHDRYRTAFAFAEALQHVQAELGIPLTQVEVRHESTYEGPDDDDGATHSIDIPPVLPAPETAPTAALPRSRRRKRVMYALSVLVVGVISAALAVPASGPTGPDDADPSVSPSPPVKLASDDFEGANLDRERWSASLREDGSIALEDGDLIISTSSTELYGASNNARNVVLQSLPSSDFRATVHLTLRALRPFQQAGLILYQDDDNYTKLVLLARPTTGEPGAVARAFQFLTERGGEPLRARASTTADLEPSFPDTVFLRLESDGERLMAAYSRDDLTYVPMPQSYSLTDLSNPRIGLLAVQGPNATVAPQQAAFHSFIYEKSSSKTSPGS